MVIQTQAAGVPPAAHLELTNYLRTSGSTLSVPEALSHAIKHWIDAQREAEAPMRGFQWKCLFLPSGSLLRMTHDGECHYAKVVGEELQYNGASVSPRQFTLMVAGPGRNAWREIWIRLSGEKYWVCAAKLRQRIEQHPVAASPVEAMAAAARTMSDALQTTLTLVQHIHHESTRQLERRIPKRRRLEDGALDD